MGGSEGEEMKVAAGGGTGEVSLLLWLKRERESIEEEEGEEAVKGGEMGGEVGSSVLLAILGAFDPDPERLLLFCT